MTDLRFALIGDDRLSPVMNHAGDSALRMASEVQLAATEADLAMAGLSRDTAGHLRDVNDQVISEATGLSHIVGEIVDGVLGQVLDDLEPVMHIGADGRQADAEIGRLVRRIAALRGQLRVGIDADDATRELDRIRVMLVGMSHQHADPDIRIAAGKALASIVEVHDDLDRLSEDNANIGVTVDVDEARREVRDVDEDMRRLGDNDGPDRAGRRFGGLGSVVGRVGSALGSLGGAAAPLGMIGAVAGAGIPLVAGLVTWLENVAPAAAIAATGAFALGSALGALKIGTSGVGAAIGAIFAPATGGGGGGGGGGGRAAAAATHAYADAQRNLRDVIEQTAQSNRDAVRQVTSAERDLGDAQKAAKQAQDDLVQAREDAARQLRDMNDSLADAKLSERDALLAVQDAEQNLATVRARGAAASQEEQQKAQLDLDKANQQLKEQRERVQDLQEDTDKANKAGVSGSQQVRDAQDKVAQTARDVGDRQQAVADAQENVRRTAAAGAEAIDKAREALQQAGEAAGGSGGGGGAAGGISAFDRAMAGLSPNARAFVQEIVKLKPALLDLKLDVQQHLFAGLASVLDTTASVLLPVLRRSLDESADSLNLAGRGAAEAADKLGTSGVLGRALDGANAGLRNLVGLPGRVVTALGQLGDAAAPAFGRVTSAVDRAADHILDKLSRAFTSGALEQDIDTAVSILAQFGDTLHNVGDIVGNVLGAAQQVGPGAFGWLNTITSALAKATATQGVQSALRSLFDVMGEIGRVGGPLLTQALQILGPVITTLAGPALRLVDALGAGLHPILVALGPVLLAAAGAVGQLADAVSPLLPLVGRAIASLGPVLVPILTMVGEGFAELAPILLQLGMQLLPPLAKVTGTVVSAFRAGAPVLAQVAQQLGSGGLIPIITSLTGLIGRMVDQYAGQWLAMFTQLLPVVPMLIPVIEQLALSVADILVALTPLLPQITQLSTQMISELLPALLPLIPPLVQLDVIFLRLATGTITRVVLPALTALTRAASAVEHGLQPMITAATWVTQHVAAAFRWLYDTLLGHSIIPDIVNGTVRWFASLPGRAAGAIANLGLYLASKARSAGSSLIGAVRSGLDGALGWIGGLPGRAKDRLGDLSGVLYNAGKSLIGGFIAGIERMGDKAAGAAGSVLSKVKDLFPNSPAKTGPFSGRGWTWYSGLAVMDDWSGAMSARTGSVVGAVAGVVGAAARAVPDRLARPGLGISPGAAAAAAGAGTGPISITVPGAGGIVMAKELQRAFLELKRTAGITIELRIG